MQPYLFPYIGYFQLINAVDRFVLYDDVNYIKKGWVNRNQILVNGRSYMFTIPVKSVSQNKKINELCLAEETKWKDRLLKTLTQAYSKTPMYDEVYPLVYSILMFGENNLSKFIFNSLTQLCAYMEIKTTIIPTSTTYGNQQMNGQNRIIDMCIREKADIYINPTNGRDLYDSTEFRKRGMDLKFILTRALTYNQEIKGLFVPNLSIIDVLMFNDKTRLKRILEQYDLS